MFQNWTRNLQMNLDPLINKLVLSLQKMDYPNSIVTSWIQNSLGQQYLQMSDSTHLASRILYITQIKQSYYYFMLLMVEPFINIWLCYVVCEEVRISYSKCKCWLPSILFRWKQDTSDLTILGLSFQVILLNRAMRLVSSPWIPVL